MATIAVVNDDSAFIELMSDLLADEGYETMPHKVGATAYELIREHKPDLVILDLRMENPDTGWMVLDMVRLDPVTTNIPVIICSADVRFLRDKAEQLHAKGCCTIEKPFRLDDLLEVVQQALDPSGPRCGNVQ